LGSVYSGALNEADHAIAAYQSMLELDSRNRDALESLEQIYFTRQAWPELFGVYEKLVDVASGDEEMADCYARMAKIAQEAFPATDGEQAARERAIDLWNRVI